MPAKTSSPHKRWQTAVFFLFVLALSYLTYMHRYTYPQAPFWDENYYITDAQREMNDMFYMQIHPPLGKLLIGWGEQLIQPNERTDQFLDTEHADEFPQGFSFAGYRFFPVLLSWLGAVLFFVIFLLITENALFAAFLSFLYIFDNALLVHNRGAMLDGPMVFFLVLTMLGFVLVLRNRNTTRTKFLLSSALFGTALALGLTTKFQNAVMFLLVPLVLWKLLPGKGGSWNVSIRKILHFAWASALPFAVFFVWIWQIHFSHMVTINPKLNNNGWYQASEPYKAAVNAGRQGSLASFPVMLRDSLTFVGEYNKGIPKLDLCKPDENGSPFFLWPVGATTINYRWETPDGSAFRYLYLVSNPAVWFAGLGAVILSVIYLLLPLFVQIKPGERHPERRFLVFAFTLLWLAYMGTMATFDRVLFLYSYFPPLVFSFALVGLMAMELRFLGRWKILEQHRMLGLGVLCALIFGFHQFYRPFTYYEPLTDEQVARRAILPIWQLRCVHCGNESPLVKHRCDA